MFRDPLSLLARETTTASPVAMTAPSWSPKVDVAVWPSGLARFDDGILELTCGDGLRIAARDILVIEVVAALGARLQLALAYRNGFDTIRRRYWIGLADQDDLQRLVTAVRGAMKGRQA